MYKCEDLFVSQQSDLRYLLATSFGLEHLSNLYLVIFEALNSSSIKYYQMVSEILHFNTLQCNLSKKIYWAKNTIF